MEALISFFKIPPPVQWMNNAHERDCFSLCAAVCVHVLILAIGYSGSSLDLPEGLLSTRAHEFSVSLTPQALDEPIVGEWHTPESSRAAPPEPRVLTSTVAARFGLDAKQTPPPVEPNVLKRSDPINSLGGVSLPKSSFQSSQDPQTEVIGMRHSHVVDIPLPVDPDILAAYQGAAGVDIEVLVAPNGKAKQVRVTSVDGMTLPPLFIQMIVDSFMAGTYQAGQHNGAPIEDRVHVRIGVSPQTIPEAPTGNAEPLASRSPQH